MTMPFDGYGLIQEIDVRLTVELGRKNLPLREIMALGENSLVERVERLGDQTRLHLNLRDHPIVTVTNAHTDLRPGDIVKIRPQNPFYFDATGARIP